MESLLLDKIDQPSDLKKLNAQQVEKLCAEIRHFMLENISKTGGHLASNLGTVELTVALHRVLETPKDKIVLMWGISATPTNCLPDAGNSLTIAAAGWHFRLSKSSRKCARCLYCRTRQYGAFTRYWYGLGQKDQA